MSGGAPAFCFDCNGRVMAGYWAEYRCESCGKRHPAPDATPDELGRLRQQVTDLQAANNREIERRREAERRCADTATLRDQFAMAALTGIATRRNESLCPSSHWAIAEICYELADAMLKARGE